MPYALLYSLLPEVAERETRTVTISPESSFPLPPAHYSLCEMFCDEPGCDCRRVMFYVVSSLTQEAEAVIAYGWESRQFYVRWFGVDDAEVIEELRGPNLNTASPQSRNAPAILDMVRKVVLSDDAYVERVKRHYAMFRARIGPARLTPSSRKRSKPRKRRRRA